ncbi:unnamed protein product, partial [marine sediment metagenome]
MPVILLAYERMLYIRNQVQLSDDKYFEITYVLQ